VKTQLAAGMALATVAVASFAISQDLPMAPVVGADFRQTMSHYATVDRAKALLMERRLSIAEIVPLVGYENKAHFTKLFRIHTGVTPGAFRQREAA
jgi:YesN/AraC family two-component response regulator